MSRATILPPIADPIPSDGERDTDVDDPVYYDDAPPPVPLDEDEKRMCEDWERIMGR